MLNLSGPVLLTRIIRIVFGGLAGLMLLGAVANILLRGHLTIISPFTFGALLVVALAFLLQNRLVAREKSEMLIAQDAAKKASQVCSSMGESPGEPGLEHGALMQSRWRIPGWVPCAGCSRDAPPLTVAWHPSSVHRASRHRTPGWSENRPRHAHKKDCPSATRPGCATPAAARRRARQMPTRRAPARWTRRRCVPGSGSRQRRRVSPSRARSRSRPRSSR